MIKYVLIPIFLMSMLYAEEEEPEKVGNFSLPSSQQPSGLFAFGGNVIDKNEIQTFLFADEFIGKRKIISDVIPSFLYGITDEFSILFNFPFSPKMLDGCHESDGLEDYYLQLEYAFYNKKTKDYVDQATVVGNMTFPTGDITKNPPTGYGGPSVFLGATYYRMYTRWFLFTGQGAILTSTKHKRRAGNQYLSQYGFGRSFCSPEGWIYAWMLEVDGQYQEQNVIRHHHELNTGGSVVFITPSVWISSKTLLLQFGVSLPVHQNLFGNQRKIHYAYNFNLGFSFY